MMTHEPRRSFASLPNSLFSLSIPFQSLSFDIPQRPMHRLECSIGLLGRTRPGCNRQHAMHTSAALTEQCLCDDPEFDRSVLHEAEAFPAECGRCVNLTVPAPHPGLQCSGELRLHIVAEWTIGKQPDCLYDCYTGKLVVTGADLRPDRRVPRMTMNRSNVFSDSRTPLASSLSSSA